MLLHLNHYSFSVFRKEWRELMVLAFPMMLAQIAAVGIGFIDTVMAGAAGKADLSAVGLGAAAFSTLFITLMGVMTALNPMIAQLFGANKTQEIGDTARQGLWFGLILGVLGMLFLLAWITPMLWYLELSEQTESLLAQYLFFIALAMPPAMMHRALHAYVSSLNRPKPIMWLSWVALLLNIPLNYVFVYGKLGMPALGGAGCGLASLIVFWFNLISLWIYAKKEAYFQQFGLFGRFVLPNWSMLKQMWTLGWPIGFSYFLEVSLFTCIVFLIARFGEDMVAAQQVVISLTSIIYMIPQAIGSAATVRVGQSLGAKQRERARYISGVSLCMGWVAAVLTVTFLFGANDFLPTLYNDDVNVRAIAAKVLLFAAVFQIFDFTQCITSYALRGYKLTKAPMVVHGVAFWGLGLLPGYFLAIVLDMQIYGFWLALIISLASAALALVWLLEKHSYRIAHERGF